MPRKRRKRWLDDDSYIYIRSGEYVRQKLADDSDCEEYRTKSLPKEGRKLLLCKAGDKWKAVALLRHIGIDLRTVRNKDEVKDIKKARKMLQMEEDDMFKVQKSRGVLSEGLFHPYYLVRDVTVKLYFDGHGDLHVEMYSGQGEDRRVEKVDLSNMTKEQLDWVKKAVYLAARRKPAILAWLLRRGYKQLVSALPGEPYMGGQI